MVAFSNYISVLVGKIVFILMNNELSQKTILSTDSVMKSLAIIKYVKRREVKLKKENKVKKLIEL